jgi:3-deoxy-manno-octulosonate cytidylyltransferase (CMP-KDO synthetase)
MYALADREVGMATMACPLTEDELINPQLVKISANWNEARKVYVLKNSKVGTVKNFYRFSNLSLDQTLYRHIPIYAYKRATLDKFVNSPPTDRELEENIEGLRILDLGIRMDVCLVDRAPFQVVSEADLEQIRN